MKIYTYTGTYTKGVQVTLHFAQYSNQRTAIQLMNARGEPQAVATVNLPDELIANDEVAVKDWSENEGMLAFLIAEGIVSEPVRYGQSGYVNVPICKLLIRSGQ